MLHQTICNDNFYGDNIQRCNNQEQSRNNVAALCWAENRRRLSFKGNQCPFRACLHGGGGPQVGEITRLGGVTRQSIYSLILI